MFLIPLKCFNSLSYWNLHCQTGGRLHLSTPPRGSLYPISPNITSKSKLSNNYFTISNKSFFLLLKLKIIWQNNLDQTCFFFLQSQTLFLNEPLINKGKPQPYSHLLDDMVTLSGHPSVVLFQYRESYTSLVCMLFANILFYLLEYTF